MFPKSSATWNFPSREELTFTTVPGTPCPMPSRFRSHARPACGFRFTIRTLFPSNRCFDLAVINIASVSVFICFRDGTRIYSFWCHFFWGQCNKILTYHSIPTTLPQCGSRFSQQPISIILETSFIAINLTNLSHAGFGKTGFSLCTMN